MYSILLFPSVVRFIQVLCQQLNKCTALLRCKHIFSFQLKVFFYLFVAFRSLFISFSLNNQCVKQVLVFFYPQFVMTRRDIPEVSVVLLSQHSCYMFSCHCKDLVLLQISLQRFVFVIYQLECCTPNMQDGITKNCRYGFILC